MAEHTPGPWRVGKAGGAVVTDTPPAWVKEPATLDDCEVVFYGGYVIAESIAPCDQTLIAAAPDLLAACRLGDFLGNEGPFLLTYTADLIEPFAPTTAKELRRKARAEMYAIIKAEGGQTQNA